MSSSRDAVVAAVQEAAAEAVDEVRARLGAVEAAGLAARVRVVAPDLVRALGGVFGDRAPQLAADAVRLAVQAAAARPEPLRALDRARETESDWFLDQRQIGYVCYVDRFGGDLRGVLDRLDHLQSLGVTYLHLMPLLRSRDGEDDGGYAVADYREVEPRLGTMADLRELAAQLHARGMVLCVDLVVNHTADQHAWARGFVAGDPQYADRYLSFPDRTLPDAYEATLLEVFPDTAPGSFTWEPSLERWVWTTFHTWQWDLDHSSPGTFLAMLDTVLFLLQQGVDVLRLDAVPFLWKRLGGICQNEPEAHLLLQAWRALVTVAAPGALFKAEAIVGPEELVRYLGAHPDGTHRECHLAYHNQLMVQLWSAVATRSVALTNHALRRLAANPPGTGWCTYLRGHDDIGWAIADEDAGAVGLDPRAHRAFLADFYAGRFPGSFADGLDFQVNPRTGDVRTSGTLASLCGIGQALALGDEGLLESGLRRHALLHAALLGYPGTPLLFSGDEWALRNDPDWADDPAAGRDNRWTHRPRLPREAPDAVAGRAQAALEALVRARQDLPALRGDTSCEVLDSGDDAVLALLRASSSAPDVLVLVNVAERPARVAPEAVQRLGAWTLAAGSEEPERHADGGLGLAGLSWAWLVADDR